ncbi:hypothetical protein Tco_0782174 [Tanacetum coccineum]
MLIPYFILKACITIFLEISSTLTLYDFKEDVEYQSNERLAAATTRNTYRFRIQKNLHDKVSHLHYPFSFPERLKADNTVRVNRVLMRFMDDLFYGSRLDSALWFSNQRLEQTATFSIPTNSE